MDTGNLFKKIKPICVVGDVMLDRFFFGTTVRLSPEAPVLDFSGDERNVTEVPGGAGNVALGICALGAPVVLIGVVGDDEWARKLEVSFLEKATVCALENMAYETPQYVRALLLSDASRRTTRKIRFIASGQGRGDRGQQVFRYNEEDRHPVCRDTEDKILAKMRENIGALGAIVISDYTKGVITGSLSRRILALAQEHAVPVLVDTKPAHMNFFYGSTIITPNKEEVIHSVFGSMTEETEGLAEKASTLLSESLQSAVLTTMGDEGMILIEQGKEVLAIPPIPRVLTDPVGAGDTVVATLAVCMVAGYTLAESARLANMAASIAVGKPGTAVVYRAELCEFFEEMEVETAKHSRGVFAPPRYYIQTKKQ